MAEARTDQPILSVRHLKQHFKTGIGRNKLVVKAVDDVSFDIFRGEVFGLVGESGCGKTTTGRSIIKLYEPTDGEVYFLGERISAGVIGLKDQIKEERYKADFEIKGIKEALTQELAGSDEATKVRLNEKAQKEIHAIEERRDAVIKTLKRDIPRRKEDTAKNERGLLNKMQMIFQDPIASLNPRMTVKEIIAEGLRIAGESKEKIILEKVHKVLETVGLLPEHASRYPHEFSGGQRQRIGIARSLVVNPEFIIADEPISALDVSIQAQVINLLNDLRRDFGITILFIAHDLSVVKYFADRIGVMYYGKLVELADKDELFKNPLHPYTKSLLSAVPLPDPQYERGRQRMKYDPTTHDYSSDLPELHEIKKGHFIYANQAEIKAFKQEIK